MSSSSEKGTHDQKPAPAAGGPRSPGGEDAVLGALQEFQSGLEGLRSLYQERMAATSKLAEREEELKKESKRVSAAESELKKIRGETDSLRESVEKSRQQVEASRQELEQSRRQVDQLAGKLASRETELNKSMEAVQAQREALNASAGQLSDREAALAQRLAEQEALRKRVAELERTVEESKEALGAERAKAAGQEALRAQIVELERAVAESKEVLGTERAKASGQDGLRTKIVELERSVAESKAALAAQQGKAAEQEAALRREFEAAVKSRGTESARAGNASAEAERVLKADLEAAKARVASQQGAIDEHTKALAAERADKQRLSRELAAAQTASSKGGSESERAKLEKAAKALIELRTERDEMSAQAQRLKKELEAARKAGAASAKTTGRNDALVELRRSRLKRYRLLVREESQKVLRATETLKSRFEHAEKLTAQRDQLAEAAEKIKIAQRKIEGQRSKAKAAATMFYAMSSSLVLAVASWMVTGWVAPGTYVASAVVSAQGRGRELNAAELGEWQSFHQQLINDPRFHEVVAERMSRRGLVTLATPGAVRELVTGSVNTRSAEDGELVVELRGEGAERTARVLETLTTALASHANAARQQRVDGAVTTIKQAAQAGSEPIDNSRLIWAGGMWLASLGVAGLVGWLLWKRMSSAKSSFEKSSNVDELLDEAKWLPPAMATQMRRERRMMP